MSFYNEKIKYLSTPTFLPIYLKFKMTINIQNLTIQSNLN